MCNYPTCSVGVVAYMCALGEQGITASVLRQFTGLPLIGLSHIFTSSSPLVACMTQTRPFKSAKHFHLRHAFPNYFFISEKKVYLNQK